MGKRLITFKLIISLALMLSIPGGALAATNINEFPEKNSIKVNKPWVVKLTQNLDRGTINNDNIIVKDLNGKVIKTTTLIGKDSKTIIIYPPVGGYIPSRNYSLELGRGIKSKGGKNLSKYTKMNFNIAKELVDFSDYKSLSNINELEIVQKPLMENNNASFKVTSNFEESVQYRAFLFKYPDEVYDNSSNDRYSKVPYIEITKGYSNSINPRNPYIITKKDGLESGRYKLIVYVKAFNRQGISLDNNTDYDNYSSMYFKVINKNIISDKKENETLTYTNYNKTLTESINDQIKNGQPVYSEGISWIQSSKALVKYYMNPNNFLDDLGKYQFLNLNYMEGVTANDLNNLLKGRGILENKGETFLKAAKINNINPIYLVSHALLETGNGKSVLATGVLVSTVKEKSVTPRKTYNMFGVGAIDKNPVKCGSEYAYTEKWFTPEEAILGGAKFIGNGYINSDKYKQNTLYKMRWNINVSYHQYATDIGWAYKQLGRIRNFMAQCKSAKPVFDIPKFK
ncbi:beta-N-acetylglucosaminidase [Clostridium botulinum]|uniref:Beta-N-acetylglucosaminidase n=1 Tax=Clostridium botulinum C/D str. DC5 TaxID=1443128 RepID=A0A0A0ID11_CLOBO|nr:N-acetylglucosaminidase [Clostridium botulinum]MCD3233767.1 beta-N-acetylglucosaminidase [Clostridium botulinum D/C]KGM99334.1 beta-N-acetylglucosaminidase [Clostridium botulinum C/D str. DC5]KOC52890.1 beta-N-acetylglucosaminidase [Clostridium botulinum]KOC55890.1 beta-N-acetylglucosaminidase [Clostridium botulinum]MCD3239528.1 beta-N-acetylglucosaminidase [Clostridium botulinum D/C]